jgi:hypothetical protein
MINAISDIEQKSVFVISNTELNFVSLNLKIERVKFHHFITLIILC